MKRQCQAEIEHTIYCSFVSWTVWHIVVVWNRKKYLQLINLSTLQEMEITFISSLNSQLIEEKGVFESFRLNVLVAIARAEVSRCHVRFQVDGSLPLHDRFVAKSSRKLGWFPVRNSGVKKSSKQKNAWVRSTFHVIHGRILHHIVEVFLFIWITPFCIFSKRHRNSKFQIAHFNQRAKY